MEKVDATLLKEVKILLVNKKKKTLLAVFSICIEQHSKAKNKG